MKITALWYVMPCDLVHRWWVALKQTLVPIYHTTEHHIPEDSNFDNTVLKIGLL